MVPPRRAPSACDWCRRRKVRCDAATFGCPCTRCIQDGRDGCSVNSDALTLPLSPRRPGSTRPIPIQPTLPPGHVSFAFYPFIGLGGSARIPKEDLAFLASKGCLSLPNRSLIDEFITQYFLQVHPWAPVIDEAKFWDLYQSDDGIATASNFSLLVLQALLFISAPYVSVETLEACGFAGKREAWDVLYNRTKLLFDLKAEDRPFAQAQATFLLAFYSSGEKPQAASLWLSQSIQITMALDPQDVELSARKRLWWSIVLRDKSLCLGLRRRAQITSIGQGMPTLFLSDEDFADEITSSRVYDRKTKSMLITIFQEQCRLAVLLTDMATLVFTSNGLDRPSLSPSEFRDTSIRIRRVRSSLEEWKFSFSLMNMKNVPTAVTHLINMTLMYYHTAQMNLAHYQAILIENHLPFVGNDYYTQVWSAGNMLHHSMNKLTEVMAYFGQVARIQNFPLSMLACVVLPLVLTAVNLKFSTSRPEIGDQRQRLELLGEIVRQSARVYDVTDCISSCTNDILRLAYVTYSRLCYPPHKGSTNRSPTSAGNLRRANRANRVHSWQDAFLQSPPAYLLISMSLDYYLSVGRLPIDNALPEFVRCIPCVGGKISLPWNVKLPNAIDEENDRRRDNHSIISTHSMQSRTAVFGYLVETLVWMPDPEIIPDEGDSDTTTDCDQPSSSEINLDYMPLDSVGFISPEAVLL